MSAALASLLVGAAGMAASFPGGSGRGLDRHSVWAMPARGPRAAAGVVAVAVALATAFAADGLTAALDLGGGAVVAALVGWLVRLRRAESARRRRQDAVVGLCTVLAAELHAGLPAQTSLTHACREWPGFARIERAARLGGDIPGAMDSLAGEPGSEGMAAIAAGWTVAAHSGVSLAGVLDRLAESLRDSAAAQGEIDAALEPPRATARLLAVLPLFAVALGSAMGAGPLAFLVRSTAGHVCLMAGVVLGLAGVVWVEGLAAAASRQ
jgi:tight adherence protein B